MYGTMLRGVVGSCCLLVGLQGALYGETSAPDTVLDALTRSIAIELDADAWPEHMTPAMPNHHVDVVPDPAGENGVAFRITFPEGSFYGASMHIPLADDQGWEPEAAVLTYQVYFDEGWETTLSGKLPGFSGTYFRSGWGGRPSDGYNGWSARGMFSPTTEDGAVPIGAYVYHTETQVDNPEYVYGEGISYHNQSDAPPLERGRWYTVRQYIRLNSLEGTDVTHTTDADTDDDAVGNKDGVLRAWIDDTLVYNREDLRFRHTDKLRIQSAWLDFYHGGKDPAPHTLVVYIRDITVKTDTSAE